jgi:hypothetical protein
MVCMCNADGGDEHMLCYLLDAAHSMAVLTLVEIKTNGSTTQSIIHNLKSLSTFLRLIASLCARPLMVRSILTSQFLPAGLVKSVMSVVAALSR